MIQCVGPVLNIQYRVRLTVADVLHGCLLILLLLKQNLFILCHVKVQVLFNDHRHIHPELTLSKFGGNWLFNPGHLKLNIFPSGALAVTLL